MLLVLPRIVGSPLCGYKNRGDLRNVPKPLATLSVSDKENNCLSRLQLVCVVGPAAVPVGDLDRREPIPSVGQVETRALRIGVAAVLSPEGTVESYAELAKCLCERLGRPAELVQRRTYAEEDAQLGIVSIDDTTCSLCGQCAKICPTNVLRESYEDEAISILFDPKACVNCSQCIAECPEIERGAISVRGLIDTCRLAAGRIILNEGTVFTCEICGNAIAPTTMMNRIGDLLGEEFQSTMKMLQTCCLDCRGRG